jgi:hypothetical protein
MILSVCHVNQHCICNVFDDDGLYVAECDAMCNKQYAYGLGHTSMIFTITFGPMLLDCAAQVYSNFLVRCSVLEIQLFYFFCFVTRIRMQVKSSFF